MLANYLDSLIIKEQLITPLGKLTKKPSHPNYSHMRDLNMTELFPSNQTAMCYTLQNATNIAWRSKSGLQTL